MSEHLNAASRLQAGALGIVYLLCQVAVLRSNLEKQRFEFLVVSAGCASLVRGCPAQIALRFVSLLYHRASLSRATGDDYLEIAAVWSVLPRLDDTQAVGRAGPKESACVYRKPDPY